MSAFWNTVKREPVRYFTVAAALTPLITTGLILFDWWHPAVEQLAYVNGLPAAVAVAFGVTVVRNAVTPNDKLPGPIVERADQMSATDSDKMKATTPAPPDKPEGG